MRTKIGDFGKLNPSQPFNGIKRHFFSVANLLKIIHIYHWYLNIKKTNFINNLISKKRRRQKPTKLIREKQLNLEY